MAQILQHTTPVSTDKYLSLSGESYYRKFISGSNWNTVRIGVLFSVQPNYNSSSYFPVYPQMTVGMCSGSCGIQSYEITQSQWLGGFIGGCGQKYATSYLQSTYANNIYRSGFGIMAVFTGSTIGNGAGSTQISSIPINGYVSRSVFVIEIDKRNSNNQYNLISYAELSGSNPIQDYTLDGLLSGITGSTDVIVNGTTLVKTLTATGSGMNHSLYPLDTVNINVNNPSATVNIYDVVIYKVN